MAVSDVVSIRISVAASLAVGSGHPWVYRETNLKLVPGTSVEMTNPDGKVVGWGIGDEGPIAVRVLGRGRAESISRILNERVFRADRARIRLIPPGTNAYRVIAGAGDGLPGIVVDRYDNIAVLRLYSKGWELHIDRIEQAVSQLPWVDTLYRRYGVTRVDGMKGGEVLFGAAPPEKVIINEHGMRLLVRPIVGQKTGMFLDQREHRRMIRQWANGRIVANLFSYTGGFSVAAALGGASRVTTVDIAAEAIEDAKEIFQLNGVNPKEHAFEVADAFEWQSPGPVGLLIVDPPAMSKNKRSDNRARHGYRKLHRRLASMVSKGGLIATSSCSSRVTLEQWRSAVAEGLLQKGDWSWHWLSREPVDHPVAVGHPEGQYLKFALARRR